jgi:uncharacterized protein YegJ (DUF2314 family)
MNFEASKVPLFAELIDTEPEIVEAVSKARKALPSFLCLALKMQLPLATYLIKVPFIDRSDTGEGALVRTERTATANFDRPTCHLWLKVTSVFDDLLFCSVCEAPDALRLAQGTSFVVEISAVEDWMINQNGVAYGGFSLRAIRSRLATEAQADFDAYIGISEFKELTANE